MSVVRGRPPGLAGGMNGSSSRYWSSLSAWPEPKSPTRTRSAAVHIMASLRKAPAMASPQPLTPRQPDPYSLSKRAVRVAVHVKPRQKSHVARAADDTYIQLV